MNGYDELIRFCPLFLVCFVVSESYCDCEGDSTVITSACE